VRDGALDRNRNDIGLKWPLVKKDTRVFLVKQINKTNKLSIKLRGYQILPFHSRLDIHSHDDMSRRTSSNGGIQTVDIRIMSQVLYHSATNYLQNF
jgi:hypothetical protein